MFTRILDWGKEGVKRAAAAKESATWKNPNDLAILTTAGWYSKYERAGVLESSICVANSNSTLKEFQRWYNPPENFDCEVVLWGCDHKVFRPPNIDNEAEQLEHERIRKNTIVMMKKHYLILNKLKHPCCLQLADL